MRTSIDRTASARRRPSASGTVPGVASGTVPGVVTRVVPGIARGDAIRIARGVAARIARGDAIRTAPRIAPGLAAGLAALVIALAPAPALPAVFENLYTIVVPLGGRNDGRPVLRTDEEFDRFAMGELLIRVTGQRDAPTHPALQDLVRDAGRYVVQRGNPDRDNLLVVFDPLGLQDALTLRNQPVWGEERPLTLLWVAMDGGPGERDVLTAGSAQAPRSGIVAAVADALREELLGVADQRGLPVALPLMDAQDLDAVDFVDVWGLFSERLEPASARYGPDAILGGRLRVGAAGIETARWTLLRDGSLHPLPGDTVRSGLDGLADLYALEYSSIGGATGARLTVIDVETLDDYGRVISYLEGVSVVQSVHLERLAGTELTLRVEVRGGVRVLNRVLALGGVLTRLPAGRENRGADLIYSLPR